MPIKATAAKTNPTPDRIKSIVHKQSDCNSHTVPIYPFLL